MEILVALALFAVLALSTTSYVHRLRQRAFLTKQLKVDESFKRRAARELGVDGGVLRYSFILETGLKQRTGDGRRSHKRHRLSSWIYP